MSRTSNEKRETTHDGWNGTTKSRKIRTLGKKETYNYLRILEADTIKQVKKNFKEYLRSYSRQNYFAETLSKG